MTHDPFHPSQPDPQQGPPPGAVVSPDGKQWFDEQTRMWRPVPVPEAQAPSPAPAPARARALSANNRQALIVLGVVALGAAAYWTIPPLLAGDQRLAEAHDNCHAGSLGDDDRSLSLDMEGEDSFSGNDSYDDVRCALNAVGIPDATWKKMGETTSMQGRQTDSWDGIEASWTYHPDHGLDVILELED